MTDEELVCRARAGSVEAWDEIVGRWAPAVIAVCHALVRRPDVAEDLAQETFLRGFVGITSLDRPDRLPHWLRGIARRVSFDWLASMRRAPMSLSEIDGTVSIVGDAASCQVAAVEREDEAERLREEVGRLPEALREVILLHYYGGHSYVGLARLLGVAPATVNLRLARAESSCAGA